MNSLISGQEFMHDIMTRTESPAEVALQRAQKGLAWLREVGPALDLHVEQVDLDTLRLSSGCECVLGQLGGRFNDALREINRSVLHYTEPEANLWAVAHGFLSDGSGRSWVLPDDTDLNFDWAAFTFKAVRYSNLDAAWRQVLTEDRMLHQETA